MFSAAAIVASFCLLGTANAGEAALPDDQPAVVSGEYSPEGRRLLVTVVVLACSLVGMERYCAWRLRRRHQDAAAVLPAISRSPAAFSLPALNSQAKFLTAAAALGVFQVTAATLSAQNLYVANTLGNNVERVTLGGTASKFVDTKASPRGMAFDAAGNLYVANNGGYTIERFTPDGAESVFADEEHFASALAFDAAGNLYVAEAGTNTIDRFTADGVEEVFAYTNDNPEALAFDQAGNLYVACSGPNTIEKFTAQGGIGVVFASAGLDHPTALAFDAAGNLYVANTYANTITRITPAGVGSVFASTGLSGPEGLAFDTAGNLYVANSGNNSIEKFTPDGVGTVFTSTGLDGSEGLAISPLPSSFFEGEASLSGGVFYLSFPNSNYFGYYTFLSDQRYVYHFDLGYEYVFDAKDGKNGVYLYDFASQTFFYTSPTFPFPYLYDFSLNTVLYYYPDLNNPGHYNTNGVRYFYDFKTQKIISK